MRVFGELLTEADQQLNEQHARRMGVKGERSRRERRVAECENGQFPKERT